MSRETRAPRSELTETQQPRTGDILSLRESKNDEDRSDDEQRAPEHGKARTARTRPASVNHAIAPAIAIVSKVPRAVGEQADADAADDTARDEIREALTEVRVHLEVDVGFARERDLSEHRRDAPTLHVLEAELIITGPNRLFAREVAETHPAVFAAH